MKSKQRVNLLLSLTLLIGLLITTTGSTGAYSIPPAVKIFVAAPPKDLSLSIDYNHHSFPDPQEMIKTSRLWETYFDYYYQKLPGRFDEDFSAAVLVVRSDKYNFEVKIPRDPQARMYLRYMTLDLQNQTLSFTEPAWRKPVFVISHLLLALLLKGVILYLLGLRRASTWKIFLVINLITQTLFSLYLADFMNELSAVLFYYIIAGVLTLIEAFAVWILVDEIRSGAKAFLTVFLINIVSVFIGAWIFPPFPR